MKKIAFIGTHGVRKTTHAHELFVLFKRRGINVGTLDEVARMCPLPINENRTRESQEWIFYSQITKEIEKGNDGIDYLICDRGILDNYAYYVHPFGRDNLMDEVLRRYVQTYEKIIRVPILGGEITADGVRSTDKEFQETIDSIVLSLLREFEVPYEDFTSVEEIAARYIPKHL